MKKIFILTLLITFSACNNLNPYKKYPEKARRRLLLMVFDQMRPDYVDRFDLQNFKRLRSISTEYTSAYVGHFPSITLISHAVMSSGLEPRQLPWGDEIFLDKKEIFAKKDSNYLIEKLSTEDLLSLTKLIPPERTLPVLIRNKFDGKVIAVGSKAYAALTFGTANADSIISLKKNDDICIPQGLSIPSYISNNPRFTLNCSSSFGTDNALKKLDARYVPGNDQKALGGDTWVADATLEVMEHENWSGLLVTFSGIDKAGHVWGTQDESVPKPFTSEFTFEKVLQNADIQLGRILDYLQQKNLLDETLIVVTADHGAQTNKYYLGNGNPGYSGKVENSPLTQPPFWIQRLSKFGCIRNTVQDSAIRIWTCDGQPLPIKAMAEISGVTEIFRLVRDGSEFRYESEYRNDAKISEWEKEHNKKLVATAASDKAPDYIVALENGVGFDVIGDHGGLQEKVQKIPLFVGGASSGEQSNQEIALKDVYDLIRLRLRL